MITKQEAIFLLNRNEKLQMYARPYRERTFWIFRIWISSVAFLFHMPSDYFKDKAPDGLDYRLDVTVDEALQYLAGYYVGIPKPPKEYEDHFYFE